MELKGGFQSIDLSKADLTASTLKVDGLSKACAGANDKPVRIKMPGGVEYYGSLKPSVSGFEISFIGADSTISTISVDDTDDTFTIAEVNPGGDSGEGNVYLDTGVNIGTATSANPYITENDGIITLAYSGSSALANAPTVTAKTGSTMSGSKVLVGISAGISTTAYTAVFVKKGSVLYCTNIASDVYAMFLPYKPAS